MRLHPVILIHDLGGSPQDWDRWGLESLLVNEGGFDPRLIRRFDYGYRREGRVPQYDAQGDLIQIAHRLSDDPAIPDGEAFQVDRLAAESQELGGPGKVSLVALGSGGLIARYYLSRAEPDSLGTRYNGCVGRAILLGTPNRGGWFGSGGNEKLRRQKWWLRPFMTSGTEAALDALVRGFEALRDRVLAEMAGESSPPISLKALGALHSAQDSFLLRWLNRPERAPRGVRFHCLAGDIGVDFLLPFRGGNRPIHLRLGDLLVAADSAAQIPGAKPDRIVFDRTYEVDLTKPQADADPLAWFGGGLPPVAHTRLMGSREVQQAILDILCAD